MGEASEVVAKLSTGMTAYLLYTTSPPSLISYLSKKQIDDE